MNQPGVEEEPPWAKTKDSTDLRKMRRSSAAAESDKDER